MKESLKKAVDLNDLKLPSDPLHLFENWFNFALNNEANEPNAMILATADRQRKPSARTVLLKGFSNEGFVFFTNYNSRKGSDISENPYGAIVFLWQKIYLQVRVTGLLEKIDREKSERYFHSRSRDSQIAAWASDQSSELRDRAELDKRFEEYEKKFKGGEIPLPEHWGGYRLVPETIEFWQGREQRMHDRVLYYIDKGEWKFKRLAP